MSIQRVTLPCGCVVMADWGRGSRRIVCEGNTLHGLDTDPVVCPGGRGYAVTGELFETVIYTASPLSASETA